MLVSSAVVISSPLTTVSVWSLKVERFTGRFQLLNTSDRTSRVFDNTTFLVGDKSDCRQASLARRLCHYRADRAAVMCTQCGFASSCLSNPDRPRRTPCLLGRLPMMPCTLVHPVSRTQACF